MKKVIKVAISGISIGIAFLMIGYIGIYYTLGEKIFVQEITELSQIKNLECNLIITGISGLLLSLSIYFVEQTMKQEKTNGYKVVLSVIFLIISAIISMMLIQKMSIDIADMLVIFSASLVSMYALFNCIRILWKDVTSILEQKKEKNEQSQNPEKGNE